MGAHTDYGIVTVLWADPDIRGLQILDEEGAWHDVIPSPGALLVNLGDLLARWTNDRWISTLHRVLPPTDENGTWCAGARPRLPRRQCGRGDLRAARLRRRGRTGALRIGHRGGPSRGQAERFPRTGGEPGGEPGSDRLLGVRL